LVGYVESELKRTGSGNSCSYVSWKLALNKGSSRDSG
jgi:hypothetical protein